MKKILITGGCGFVGHHAVENYLRKTDWEILIFFLMIRRPPRSTLFC
jgi:nucleoside-diphosphate-sugar epimerase